MVFPSTVAVKSSPSDVIDGRNNEFPPSNLIQPPFVGTRMVMDTSLDGGGSLSYHGKESFFQLAAVTCRLTGNALGHTSYPESLIACLKIEVSENIELPGIASRNELTSQVPGGFSSSWAFTKRSEKNERENTSH